MNGGWLCVGLLLLAGCSVRVSLGDDPDAGSSVDSGSGEDSGSAADAGPGVDAGCQDAGLCGVSFLAAGASHACAVTLGGAVRCWGDNLNRQVGDGMPGSRLAPSAPLALTSPAVSVTLGTYSSCALLGDGGVDCWGRLLGTSNLQPTPAPLLYPTVELASGTGHSCLLTPTGRVKCWGVNDSGELGTGTFDPATAPVDVSGLGAGVRHVYAGGRRSCALLGDGGLVCWGQGGLGNGGTAPAKTPVPIAVDAGVRGLSMGSNHMCALLEQGGVSCWGSNGYGQLGDGTETDSPTPKTLASLTSGVRALACGGSHTCALLEDGRLFCWGANFYGELGNGGSSDIGLPVQVQLPPVRQVVTGFNFTCALLETSAVRCWGDNTHGEVGDGTGQNYRRRPVDVAP